jgi:hypothetical protein
MQNPNSRVYTQEDINRLKELVNEGCNVLTEIETLKEGLSETVKAIAEEVDIKSSQLMKALKIAHKNSFDEENNKFSEIEDILAAVGRK